MKTSWNNVQWAEMMLVYKVVDTANLAQLTAADRTVIKATNEAWQEQCRLVAPKTNA